MTPTNTLHSYIAFIQSRRTFFALLALVLCSAVLVVDAAPSPLLFTGNDLQNDGFVDPNAVYRLYYLNSAVPRSQAKRDKKYDRNCFFSPVQCMLSYNANANDVIYHPSGRR